MEYDDNGRRTTKSKGASAETWVYEYDHNGHLIEVEKRNTAAGAAVRRIEYAYDAFGNRISRVQSVSGASTERFVLDGWKTNLDPLGDTPDFTGQENWDVLQELNSANAFVLRRIHGNHVDELLGRQSSSGAMLVFRTDRQGSVRGYTNEGTVTGTITYDGFGRIASETTSSDCYRYTGREYDHDTATTGPNGQGLLHLRDRELSLDIGKFLTRDRMGFDAGDANLVRYVGNGYTNASDPSGYEILSLPRQLRIAVGLLKNPDTADLGKSLYHSALGHAEKKYEYKGPPTPLVDAKEDEMNAVAGANADVMARLLDDPNSIYGKYNGKIRVKPDYRQMLEGQLKNEQDERAQLIADRAAKQIIVINIEIDTTTGRRTVTPICTDTDTHKMADVDWNDVKVKWPKLNLNPKHPVGQLYVDSDTYEEFNHRRQVAVKLKAEFKDYAKRNMPATVLFTNELAADLIIDMVFGFVSMKMGAEKFVIDAKRLGSEKALRGAGAHAIGSFGESLIGQIGYHLQEKSSANNFFHDLEEWAKNTDPIQFQLGKEASDAEGLVVGALSGIASATLKSGLKWTLKSVGRKSGKINIQVEVATKIDSRPRLFTYTTADEFVGDVFHVGHAGRAWATRHVPGSWAFNDGLMNTLLRVWRTGQFKKFVSVKEIVGPARDLFVRVRALGPARGWKRIGGQYFTTRPGDVDLATGKILRPTVGQMLRFAGDVGVYYTVDGALLVLPTAGLIVYLSIDQILNYED